MTTEPKDPKVVAGGEITFEGSTPQADSLEGVVQAAGTGSASVVMDWELENMAFLAEGVKITLRNGWPPGGSSDEKPISLDDLGYKLAPYIYCLTPRDGNATIRLSPVDPAIFRLFLDAEYGPSLARTGIYQAIGLDKDEVVPVDALLPYFPEVAKLQAFDLWKVRITRNPYQFILTLPLKARPFFTRVLQEEKATGDSSARMDRFTNPFTLRDVLKYAEKVNQVERVKEYMEMLNPTTTTK